MNLHTFRSFAASSVVLMSLVAASSGLLAQESGTSTSSGPMYQREKSPTLIDPAGPTISLTSSEPVFLMATALNACGYDEGLDQSALLRKQVRDEVNQAMTKSEAARDARDKLCLYIAQHRMTGTQKDISQYISLALYITPPPELETSADLTEMPPDSTQVVEILPLLRKFVATTDLHGIWLTQHKLYDDEASRVHDPLSKMIVATNLYLKMPASTYDGRRFIVVIEPMLSPRIVNARVYGTDYVVVTSPVDGKIPMSDVRHTYLHYLIEPLLYARANAIDRMQPILKEVREAPLEFRFRSDSVTLTIECLIKAIEARTMDTGVPDYKIPAGTQRSELPRFQREQIATEQKQESVRLGTVKHDMTQGFVLTQYFYEQLTQFEKDPASLRDTIGEMVYSMDVDQQVHRARNLDFDKNADADVLTRSTPRKLTGLDLAEVRLAAGDVHTAVGLAHQALVVHSDDASQSAADGARANFILARAAAMTGNPEEAINDFQKTLATSKDARLLSWSHIYLGRMLDLSCKRDEAVSEYKAALEVRDGQMDTRVAAERGVKTAYSVKGHSCSDDDDDEKPDTAGASAPATTPKQ